MAFVLLNRLVRFVNNPEVEEEEEEETEEVDATTGGCDLREVPSWEEMEKGIAAHLRAMTPDPRLQPPPMVSYLSMVRPVLSDDDSNLQFGLQLEAGFIAATHERFIVLYAGPYRPANLSDGCYLVYDASQTSGSLSTVPRVPYSASHKSVGNGTIIMEDVHGTFVLVELLTEIGSAPPQAVLCLWAPGTEGWEKKVGRLPTDLCPPKHVFTAHMAFCFNDPFCFRASICCWVDLRVGLLLCNALSSGNAKFFFVPLPDGYAIDTASHRPHPPMSPRAFRSVSCVAGTIKFVSLDGNLEQPHTIRVTTWALDLLDGLSVPEKWTMETSTLPMNQLLLYAGLSTDDYFTGFTQIRLMYPVLSTEQIGHVYLVLAQTKTVEGHRETKVRLLEICTSSSDVISCVKYDNSESLWPELFGSEIGLYFRAQKTQGCKSS